jgi:hypothetical protein
MNNYEIQNELKMLMKDATANHYRQVSTTDLIKRNFIERLRVYNPKEVIDLDAFEQSLYEMGLTDDEPYDDTMVDDVADVYPDVLYAKNNYREEMR